MLEKKKIIIYSNIRVLATILVLIGHCTTLSYGTGTNIFNCFDGMFPKTQVYLKVLYQFIYSFHMPLFVTLSGALFEQNKTEDNFQLFLKKKAKKLLVPYIITAIFFFIPIRFLIDYYNHFDITKVIVYDLILGRDINYLWFLVMLMEISVIFWFFRKKIHQTINKYMTYSFVFILLLLNIISFHCGKLPFQLHRTCEFLLWFYFGIIVNKKIKNKKNNHPLKITILICLQMILFFFNYYMVNSYYLEVNNFLYYGLKIIEEINRIILSFLGIVICWSLLLKLKVKHNYIFMLIESNSFYIYLIHVPLITLFSWFVQVKLVHIIDSSGIYVLFVILKLIVGMVGSIIIINIIKVIEREIKKYVKN